MREVARGDPLRHGQLLGVRLEELLLEFELLEDERHLADYRAAMIAWGARSAAGSDEKPPTEPILRRSQRG